MKDPATSWLNSREYTGQMKAVEERLGEPLPAFLRREFKAGKTWREVADQCWVSTVTLRHWARRLGIRVETRRAVVGGTRRKVG